MARTLTPAESFRKYVVANERALGAGLKEGKAGWWSMRCPAREHGQPLRLRIGDQCHIFYTDLGKCPEPEVFSGLVALGMPGEYLKRPKGGKPAGTAPRREHGEGEAELAGAVPADVILDIAFGEGTATERMVTVVMAALDGELPEGPMVGVLAGRLRVSERTLYRVTAGARRRNRNY